MKKMMNSKEWEELIRKNPELAKDLEAFFHDKDGGVSSVVGFYSVLRMRLWRFLSFQKQNITSGEARADEALPPHSS